MPIQIDTPTAHVVRTTEDQWTVECPYGCGKHYHGTVEGYRVAHCPPKTPGSENGYYVTISRG